MSQFFRTHARPGYRKGAPVRFLPPFGHSALHRHIRMTGRSVSGLPDPACPDGRGAGHTVGTGLSSRCTHSHIWPLAASGWSFTEAITADSVRRMVGAAIAEKSFLTAPVSSLYAFGRKQDLALQRGRNTISQRNHMRLWLAPFRCEGRPVWVRPGEP